jgi:hypothetical protein
MLKFNKYSPVKVIGARATKNKAMCRAVDCNLEGHIIPKGGDGVEFNLKVLSLPYMCFAFCCRAQSSG